jgi:hypothetical protein
VDPSSLIFVAIIGVWVAYLVPHWLRRRDELSQSRTPDRFSGGLRVLQRRSRKSRPDRSVHRSGDAVLTSPRVVVDADGEFLYIPADRALAARAQRQAVEVAHAAAVEAAAAAEADAAAAAEADVAAVEVESKADAETVEAEAEAVEVEAVEPEAEAVDVQVDAEAEADARARAIQQEAVAQAFARAEARKLLVDNTTAPASAAPDVQGPVDDADTAPHQPVPASSTPEAEMPEGPYDLEVAIANARLAARRRAVIMALLFVATVTSWGVVLGTSVSVLVAVPATVLLVLHALASRVAGLRSRETLMMIAVQVRSTEVAQPRVQQRQAMAPARSTDEAATATHTPDRVARRAAAVGASTWDPVPVPPPTYTLKPAVHRPEPAPLDLPAAPAAAVSRGALPRRAADVERILALESHLDELFEEPKVVNG